MRVLRCLIWSLPLCGAIASAQNPSVDDPARRARLWPELATSKVGGGGLSELAGAHFEQGLTLLEAGWRWQAWRSFREVAHLEPSAAVAHLGLALCMRDEPRRAVWSVYEAGQLRDGLDASGRALVDAFVTCFGAEAKPRGADARFDEPPSLERLTVLRDALRANSAGTLAKRFAELIVPAPRTMPDAAAARAVALRRYDAWLVRERRMPFEIPGYAQLLERAAVPFDRQLLPRHPHFARFGQALPVVPFRSPSSPPADSGVAAPVQWAPPQSLGLDLPLGLGGQITLDAEGGKPTLVVFFLGFGCVHCIEQLGALAPQKRRFDAAGIRIVTVGTDDAGQVKASYQMALENGDDPLPFDVACDPEGVSFKRWGAWDEFKDEALHGTYLIDAKGRVLWQDVSIEPFLDIDFLVEESTRLLGAWESVD